MKNFLSTLSFELKHFMHSPFKIFAVLLFLIAAVYGLQNGLALYKKQQAEIAKIVTVHEENITKALSWLDAGKKGPEDKPWIDVTTPMHAIIHAHTSVIKNPSALMPFSIGQAEQFGYYKQVTHRSSTLDTDLAEEIANPERLAVGTLDFSFVILYLLPVLGIILLFNIGGLEKDLGFDKLMQVNHASSGKWLLARFTFYYVLLMGVLLLIMLVYAGLTGALSTITGDFLQIYAYVVLYALLWFATFYYITLKGKGSANQAIKMATVWLLFCIVIPGSVHQLAALKHPADYMTDYLDASRDQMYKMRELPLDSIEDQILQRYPELSNTVNALDTASENRLTRSSIYGVINQQVKEVAQGLAAGNEEKNVFIRTSYVVNPVSFFQNKINSLCGTDYYAYVNYKEAIQQIIDKKTRMLLKDSWNKETVGKAKFLEYVEAFK